MQIIPSSRIEKLWRFAHCVRVKDSLVFRLSAAYVSRLGNGKTGKTKNVNTNELLEKNDVISPGFDIHYNLYREF